MKAPASWRKASPCAPRISTWSTSPATASRRIAAGRCSMPTPWGWIRFCPPFKVFRRATRVPNGSPRRSSSSWRRKEGNSMNEAVIVSTARTPLCKSWRGALNMTHGAKLGGHVVHAALERAKVDADEVEDVIIGCANPEGATGWNIARQIAIRAGCPPSVPGMTVNRFCSSGLQTIALAAQRIIAGEGDIFVAGGVESISLVQNEMNKHHFQDEWLHRHKPEIYWPMLQTAEYVARRYEITREDQDRYGVQSQQRAAKARADGKTKDEIVPITVKMKVVDKNSGQESMREVIASEDEGIRADTTYEGVSQIKPAIEGGVIAAGNASQFSDGASACVVMSDKEASRRN